MNIAVILSGGHGLRMCSQIPKQYIMVCNKPIIIYCIEQFVKSQLIDCFIIALEKSWEKYVSKYIDQLNLNIPIFFSLPGKTRQFTIYNALKKAKDIGFTDSDIVIIHDAVRPLVSEEVIVDCISGCKNNDASIATINVKDTIYESLDSNFITAVPKRKFLYMGQTPEAFKLGKYLSVHEKMSKDEILAVTGGAEFAYRCGLKVFLSKGDEMNFKITTPEDLYRFQQMMGKKQ